MKVFIKTQIVYAKHSTKYHWIVRTFVDDVMKEISDPIITMDQAIYRTNKECDRWSSRPDVDSVRSTGIPHPFCLKREAAHG